MKIQISIAELTAKIVEDGNIGMCRLCGEETYGVEPDARDYKCEFCGACEVYGLEELLMMNEFDITD